MKTMSVIDRISRGSIYRSIDIAGSGMTSQRRRLDAIASNIANADVTNVDGNGAPYLRRHVVMRPDPERSFGSVLNREVKRLKTTTTAHIDRVEGFSKRDETTPLVNGEEIEIPNLKMNVVYDPSHPDADADGYVTYPDVNVMEEMVDLITASRSYEANVTVVNAAKEMITKSLEI